MTDKELDKWARSVFSVDFSSGTEQFRDELLARCLEVLGDDECCELADNDLDLVAAAGDPFLEEGGRSLALRRT